MVRSIGPAVLCSILIGCGSSDESKAPAPELGTLSGSVLTSAYSGLDNPAILVRSKLGRVYVAPLSRTGAFTVSLPTADVFRVLLVSTMRDGSYRTLSELTWGASRWGKFDGKNFNLNLGVVAPEQTGSLKVQSGGSDSDKNEGETKDCDKATSSSSTDSEPEVESEDSSCRKAGRSDLPYNYWLPVGATFKLADAFASEGPLPAQVISVNMDGSTYHLADLRTGTAFTVNAADCAHAGNHGKARDRIVITWKNADGSTETDHMTLRYCEGDLKKNKSAASPPTSTNCDEKEAKVCDGGSGSKSKCDRDKLEPAEDQDDSIATCGGGAGGSSGGGSGNPDKDDNACGDCRKGSCGATGGGSSGGSSGGSGGGSSGGSSGGSGGGSSGGSSGSNGGGSSGGSSSGGSSSGGPIVDNGENGTPPGSVPQNGPCIVTADCAGGLACINSTCGGLFFSDSSAVQ